MTGFIRSFLTRLVADGGDLTVGAVLSALVWFLSSMLFDMSGAISSIFNACFTGSPTVFGLAAGSRFPESEELADPPEPLRWLVVEMMANYQ